jgi:uncharacterized OB-fold protein
VIHRPQHPGFADELPYAEVVIELAAGVRLVSPAVGHAIADLKIGQPVEVVFEDVTPEITLHKFCPHPQ